MNPYAQLFLVSAIVMGISYTIAKEKLFEPLRTALGGHDTWLGYLVSCPYCCSHWVAFVVVPLTGTYLVPVTVHAPIVAALLRWFLNSILVVVVAAFLRVGFYLVDESQGLVRRRQKAVEVEREKTAVEADKERLERERLAREAERSLH